jgi:radical SAM superfamily enzyme YgiQ (UPF0313 family)
MKKPNLLLIHPSPDKDRVRSRRRKRSSMAQLNLPILAAHADDRFDVRIVDENIEDIDFNFAADLVGISLMTATAVRGYEIADIFRGKGIKVVLGGMHVSFMPDEASPHADAILIGEAEYSWNDLLDDCLAGRLKKIYRSEKLHDLKGLPRPRLDLLKKGAYSLANVIETSRGCPHKCRYCAVTHFWGNRIRSRPVEEVIDEIKAMPPGDIVFIDDNIFGQSKRAMELFEAMIPLKRGWVGQGDLRISRDPELLDLARRSGCKWLFIGLETLDLENLEAMGKQRLNQLEDYEKSLSIIHRKGINIFGSFIFGLDNDDAGVFHRTLQFCTRNRLECANFYILTPFPGTQLFDSMKADKRFIHHNWSRYDANHVVFKPLKMTEDELIEGYIKAYRSFYSIGSIARRTLGRRMDFWHILAVNIGRRLNFRYFQEGVRS